MSRSLARIEPAKACVEVVAKGADTAPLSARPKGLEAPYPLFMLGRREFRVDVDVTEMQRAAQEPAFVVGDVEDPFRARRSTVYRAPRVSKASQVAMIP